MISKQAVFAGLIVSIFLVNKTTSFPPHCVKHPDYLQTLKNQVLPFYILTDPTGLQPLTPCSFDGNQMARPQWPVYMLESWHAASSTCPWDYHFDEESDRFPCRIATARLSRGHQENDANTGHHLTCLSSPESRHNRSEGKLCKPLVQDVPVVARTGCRHNGINDYAIINITITVGYTCTFV